MTLSRQYVPAIGKRITLALFSDYRECGIDNVWSRLEVKSIDGTTVTAEVLNGSQHTGQMVSVPLAKVARPIGWAERYTIRVKPEQVDNVLGWLKRGIVVRQSHDMSGSMPTAFQPMDNSNSPHWQFPEVTDSISAELCPSIFRIVKVEEQEINFVHAPGCPYCAGTGRRNIAQLASARRSPINTVHEQILSGTIQVDGYDPIDGNFDCHCRYGGFRKLGRSKRAELIKEWAQQGWKTECIPYAYGTWIRTRETIVHDWEQ